MGTHDGARAMVARNAVPLKYPAIVRYKALPIFHDSPGSIFELGRVCSDRPQRQLRQYLPRKIEPNPQVVMNQARATTCDRAGMFPRNAMLG
jgi:hypothetical protein